MCVCVYVLRNEHFVILCFDVLFWFLGVYISVFVCVRMRVCVCVCKRWYNT